MSDVEKLCAVILVPMVLAGLAAEEYRRAAKRRAQRAAEAERRRQTRIERSRQDLRLALAEAMAQLDTFAKSLPDRTWCGNGNAAVEGEGSGPSQQNGQAAAAVHCQKLPADARSLSIMIALKDSTAVWIRNSNCIVTNLVPTARLEDCLT